MTTQSNRHTSLNELRESVIALLKQQQYECAEVLLHELLEEQANDFWAWNNLGATLDKLDKTAEAMEVYQKALAISPKHPAVLFNLGRACVRTGDLDQGIHFFQSLVKIDPANFNALENLGLALSGARRYREAVPVLERCAAMCPEHVEIRYQLGKAARFGGMDSLARYYFERVLVQENLHISTLYQLGEMSVWYGEPNKARQHLSLIIQQLLAHPRPKADMIEKPIFDTGAAEVALNDLVSCLQAIGVDAFLNGGTLLGCIRDGKLIGHDKDIDVGVLPGQAGEQIEASIAVHPELQMDWIDNWENQPLRFRVKHKNGIGGDIFFYREDNDYFYCGVPRGNYAVLWRDSKFRLKPTRFLGREYLIPDNPELYLEENYGDWKTPDPWHIAALTSPNLVEEYGEIQEVTALLSISKSLWKGEWEKTLYICDWVLQIKREPLIEQVRSSVSGYLP